MGVLGVLRDGCFWMGAFTAAIEGCFCTDTLLVYPEDCLSWRVALLLVRPVDECGDRVAVVSLSRLYRSEGEAHDATRAS